MTIVARYPAKFGDETLDYVFDWAARLDEGETIVSVDHEAEGLTVDSLTTNGTETTVWVSGGGELAKTHTRVNLLATTSSTPPRKLGVQMSIQILSR